MRAIIITTLCFNILLPLGSRHKMLIVFQLSLRMRSLICTMIVLFLLLSKVQTQNLYCATIDKYDPVSKLESSHTAIILVNQSLLESIMWVDSAIVNSTFFGNAIFYGDVSTFNDAQGVQYRILKKIVSDDCFKKNITHDCNAHLPSGIQCRAKTGSRFCWRH